MNTVEIETTDKSKETEQRGLTVLSLCDGMSCGRIAFEKVGIPIKAYYASEIKSIAIKATQHNFPDTIQIGNVCNVRYEDGVLHTENGDFEVNIDMVIFGSPCQSFSRAMRTEGRVGLDDFKRSGLFYECYRVLQEVKPKWYLMENVVMKKADEEFISQQLGVQAIRLNSSLVSAQLRDRLYWTNIPNVTIPWDRGIKLTDILNEGYTPLEKANCLLANESHGYYNGCNWTPVKRFARCYCKHFGVMIAPDEAYYQNCVMELNKALGCYQYAACLLDDYEGNAFDDMRYLWKEERARLQTVPEKYVECMTEKEAADLLGDGWTVDIIAHIFKHLVEYKLLE